MFRIDPIKIALFALLSAFIAYFLYLYIDHGILEKRIKATNREKEVLKYNMEAELFSQKELTKLKEKGGKHEDLNLSVGVHHLKL